MKASRARAFISPSPSPTSCWWPQEPSCLASWPLLLQLHLYLGTFVQQDQAQEVTQLLLKRVGGGAGVSPAKK